MDEDAREQKRQLDRVRSVTRSAFEAAILGEWPSHAVVVDFGIDSQKHWEALAIPIRAGKLSPYGLDAVLGNGERLTLLTRELESNPHRNDKSLVFHTSWDVLFGRERVRLDEPASQRTRLHELDMER